MVRLAPPVYYKLLTDWSSNWPCPRGLCGTAHCPVSSLQIQVYSEHR